MNCKLQLRVIAAALMIATAATSQAHSDKFSPTAGGSTASAATDVPVAGKRADNTQVNRRDKSDATLTPMDQPNNATDLQTVASVRKAVIADKSLSIPAHNVKILAINGVVTLRGPVISAGEKTQIAALASRTAGVSKVNNQLDIRSN